jgi:ectoine hydroxylase-related dioxygenase (phytanoyl-CoA dioxygenase family)
MEKIPAYVMDALAKPYVLTQEQIDFYQKNRFIKLKQVFDKETIAFFNEAIGKRVDIMNKENTPLEERSTYGKAFLQLFNLWKEDDVVKEFVLSKRLAQIATDLMQTNGARIYHDQALFKEGGGGITPWHADQYYWPLATTKTITMWMPLVDINVSMGMLTFAEGSHTNGLVNSIPISDESESLLDAYVSEKDYPIYRPDSMAAGDATFHYGYTLHKAPGNSSDQMREVMTIIYYEDGAVITEPANDNQESDRIKWFDGMKPGELAASALNPVV